MRDYTDVVPELPVKIQQTNQSGTTYISFFFFFIVEHNGFF